MAGLDTNLVAIDNLDDTSQNSDLVSKKSVCDCLP